MRPLSRLAAAVRNLLAPRRVDADLDAEVRAAFDLFVQGRLEVGDTPSEARRAATIALGRVEQIKDEVRDVQGGASLIRVVRDAPGDVRFAVRALRRRPMFAAVALTTLALGIGANAAMFSVVHAVLLRPLPFEAADRLLRITSLNTATGEASNLSPADFFDFERESRTITRMGLNGFIDRFTVGRGEYNDAERVGTVRVSEGFFPTLGVQPALGRPFSLDDDQPGAPPVALLTDGYWRRRFGGDPAVVGRTIAINGLPTTIIGVLPPAFRHIEENAERPAELFMLYQFDRAQPNRGGHFVRAVGRLAPGRSLEEARAELTAIAARLEEQHPQDNTNRAVLVSSLEDAVVGGSRPVLLLLLGAVGFVLLVVCANMANLLLAAGGGRQREVAVRAALGAGRGRIVRQMLTESVVLGVAGAAAGAAIAWVAMPLLRALSAAGIPRAEDISIDLSVLIFTATVGLVTSLAFGLAPALSIAQEDVHDALKQAGRSGSAGGRRSTREALILVEVAVSVVLLVGAALLVESLWRLQAVDAGFDVSRTVTMGMALPTARYAEGTQIPFYRQLEERVAALPGVVAVGATNILPLSDNYDGRAIQIEDHPQPVGSTPSPQARSVTPGYFAAMGIPLVRGRAFDGRDRADSPLVAVVSESMARRYWPGADPIGRRITFNSGIDAGDRRDVGGPGSREVTGIVGDVKHLGLGETDPVPMFYTPHTQQPSYHAMTLVVRATGDPGGLIASIRSELQRLDPDVPLSDVRSLDQVLSSAVIEPRIRAVLFGLFAGLALLLAAVGVYGVVGYLVGQRTHEIGVRVALGASPARVVGLIVGDAMRPVIAGIVIGLAGALGVSRLLQAMLFGVTATDASAYVAAAIALAAAGLVATLVPARRALAVNPIAALRGD